LNQFKLITNQKNWIESTAISQAKGVAALNGVVEAVGLPDLHPGKGPVGLAVITKGVIYPHLVGGDIGCGMGLFDTGVALKKFKLEKWQKRLQAIRELSNIPTENTYGEESPITDLGTIGSGNHFAEFQKVEEIFDEAEFAKLFSKDVAPPCEDTASLCKEAKNTVLLLVHSGSRYYGQHILKQFSGLEYAADSPEASEYLKYHDHAILWAERNREAAARKLIGWLGFDDDITKLIDLKHNFIERKVDSGKWIVNGEGKVVDSGQSFNYPLSVINYPLEKEGASETLYIHRKGATSSTEGLVVIPGSRGTLTYIVKPIADPEKSGYSLSHGAGRKWARSLCKSRIINKYDRDTIRQTNLKSRVVCRDTQLLFEEAPEAYKNITNIIDVLLEHELIEVVATLRPLITYK
jgi:release factor H-coupled RctB family protein